MKRKVSAFCVVSLLCAMLCVCVNSHASSLPANFLGDVTADRVVNTTDARTVLQAAAEILPFASDAHFKADVNGDGVVNTSDARSILRYAAQIEDEIGTYRTVDVTETTVLYYTQCGKWVFDDFGCVISTKGEWDDFCNTLSVEVDQTRYDEAFFLNNSLLVIGCSKALCAPEAIRLTTIYDNGSYVYPLLSCTGTSKLITSVISAAAIPKDEPLSSSVCLPDQWEVKPSVVDGAPALSDYAFADRSWSGSAMPSFGEIHSVVQTDTKAELTTAVEAMCKQLDVDAPKDAFSQYVAAHDDAFFENGSVVLIAYYAFSSGYEPLALTEGADGSLTLELCSLDFRSVIGLPTLHANVLALDVSKTDLNGRTVTNACVTQMMDLSSGKRYDLKGNEI